MLGPHNFCEPSIIVDLRSEFDTIPENKEHGTVKSSRGSSLEEIAREETPDEGASSEGGVNQKGSAENMT
jgi:hypothetical protein